MTNTKPTMLHSDRGSVFSVFSEEELKNMTNNSKRKVAICGRINNSGIVEVPEGATLAEIIELAGGILYMGLCGRHGEFACGAYE